MTLQEVIQAWDKGESVWTCEMGGMGPGYEQAIQVLFIELVRDHIGQDLPTDETFPTWGNETIHRIDEQCGGFSGAQVGAAKQIAYRLLRDGYEKFCNSIPQDRKIQISSHWPRVKPMTRPTRMRATRKGGR